MQYRIVCVCHTCECVQIVQLKRTGLLVDCLKSIIHKGVNFKSMRCAFLRLLCSNKPDGFHLEIKRVVIKLAEQKEENKKVCKTLGLWLTLLLGTKSHY